MAQRSEHPDPRQKAFWIRLALTALVVTFPWAYAIVVYRMSLTPAMLGVSLSGIATLLVWDGTRVPRAIVGWLRGEPLRDRSSGLYNAEAWAALLESEEDRCQRYDLPASVVIVKVKPRDGRPLTQMGSRVGLGIRRVSRAHDVVACLAEDTYAVLAVNSREPNADSLIGRLRSALEAQGLSAWFSVASRHSSHSLSGAFRDAQRGLVPSA